MKSQSKSNSLTKVFKGILLFVVSAALFALWYSLFL